MRKIPQKDEVSIVLVAWNALDFTRACLESIRRWTAAGSYELVLVNNGSEDGTGEYFDSFREAVVLHNKNNLGFARGYNQGMQAAGGKFVLIINSDCIVSENWLTNMLACARSDRSIGMVGPRGNRIIGRQNLEKHFTDSRDFDTFTRIFNRPDPGKWFELSRLSGFCLLIKREVLDKVGYFDPSYGLGTHEDHDYCLRVRLAGFRLFCAGDVFIYHFSHRTFAENNLDLQEIYRHNKYIFDQKWSLYGTRKK